MAKNKNRKLEFLGNIITAENRREFMNKHVEAYKENYLKIQKQEEEDDVPPPPEDVLHKMAVKYAKEMVAREKKQLKAFIKGKKSYTYKNQTYPVITDEFIRKTNSLKEILKLEEE